MVHIFFFLQPRFNLHLRELEKLLDMLANLQVKASFQVKINTCLPICLCFRSMLSYGLICGSDPGWGQIYIVWGLYGLKTVYTDHLGHLQLRRIIRQTHAVVAPGCARRPPGKTQPEP